MPIPFLKFLLSYVWPVRIEERQSDVSGKIEVLLANGRYQLDSANVNYSFGGLHTVFQKAFKQFKIRERNIKNVLVLGFGSGSVASILQREYENDFAITGVEKDKAVIDLAKKYFAVDEYKNLTLHCEDASDFVLKSSSAFDLIVVDVFVDLLVPAKVQQEEFISALSKLLSGNGIIFFNFIARDDKTRDAGGKLYKLLSEKVGKAEWVRLFAKSTENWVFVCDKTKKS